MERMKRYTGKGLTPLIGVLAALSMGVAAVAIVLQMKERDRRVAVERELQTALTESAELKARVEEAQQVKAQTEEELGRARKDLSRTEDKLQEALGTQEKLSRSMEEREREISELKKTLEEAQAASQKAGEQAAKVEADRQTMQQQLADLQRIKQDLEVKIADISKPSVELEKVMVTGEPTVPAAPAAPSAPTPALASLAAAVSSGKKLPDGQVVVINREYDFIVMNLGRNHGLSVGQEFQIVRDNQVLGHVKVEKVYDELSAAAILPDSQKNNIREGDAVKSL